MLDIESSVLQHYFDAMRYDAKSFESGYLTQRINNDAVTVADCLVENSRE